jgi:hypothetical protein
MKIGFHLHHIDNKLKFAFLIIFLCFNTFVFSQADKARKTTQKFSTTLQLIEFGYVDSIDSPNLKLQWMLQAIHDANLSVHPTPTFALKLTLMTYIPSQKVIC